MLTTHNKIITDSSIFSENQIREIEKHYRAKFVCDTCLKSVQGEWINEFVAVFYQDDKSLVPKGGSQYFGLYYKYVFDEHIKDKELRICNAESALVPFYGVIAENGDIIYSRYRHDMRYSPDNSVWIDGGRDYVRKELKTPIVLLKIENGEVVIKPHGEIK